MLVAMFKSGTLAVAGDLTGSLHNLELDITCPECGYAMKKSIRRINHTEFKCSCGKAIGLDTDQFRSRTVEEESAFERLQDALSHVV
jgi:hypothetical protein